MQLSKFTHLAYGSFKVSDLFLFALFCGFAFGWCLFLVWFLVVTSLRPSGLGTVHF